MAAIIILAYINSVFYLFLEYEIKSLSLFILIIIVIGIVWEYLAIFIKPSSVCDYLDILIYLLGALIYWGIINKKDEI
ncbi:MAG: hypothetical protein LBT10_05305 [Methanobrevibacter sp.]|nr:hypothetical protein [Methanobrevibacter sp.]